jgi:hypothetical protein
MDLATEAALKPQIFKEAFGRSVVALVSRVNQERLKQRTEQEGVLASPYALPARWEQLVLSEASKLLPGRAGFVVQDGFLGAEWPELVSSDCVRLWEAGALEWYEAAGAFTLWLRPGSLEDEHPALHELVTRLAALPFELNRLQLNLHQAAQGSMLLAYMPADGRGHYRMRCDGGPSGSAADNGRKVTVVYHLQQGYESRQVGAGAPHGSVVVSWRVGVGMAGQGGMLNLRRPNEESNLTSISPLADRLVMFSSRLILNEVTVVNRGPHTNVGRFTVTMWLNGLE